MTPESVRGCVHGVAISQSQEGISRAQVGVAFQPALLRIEPASVGLLQAKQLFGEFLPPIVLLPRRILKLVDLQHRQRLGERVEVVVEALLAEARVLFDTVMRANS